MDGLKASCYQISLSRTPQKLLWESSCDSKKIKDKIFFIIRFVGNLFQMSRKEFAITTFEKLKRFSYNLMKVSNEVRNPEISE